MNLVTEKRVLRYFYKGKGYGTKLSAYRKAAKDELYDKVLGKDKVKLLEVYAAHDSSGKEFEQFTLECQEKEKELFAKLMKEFGFTCELINAGYSMIECCPKTYGFCGKKFKQWLEKRVKELIELDSLRPEREEKELDLYRNRHE